MGKCVDVRSAHTRGLVPATSPGDQVPSCALPILVKNCSRRDQNLVPATSPTNSNSWDQFRGTSPTNYAWSLRVYCSWGKSLRPKSKIFHRIFYFFSNWLVCIGSLDRTVVFLRFCTSNIGHWRKNFIKLQMTNTDRPHEVWTGLQLIYFNVLWLI